MKMRLIGLAVLCACSSALVAPAIADEYWPSAVLQCDGNDLAIRFGGHFNTDPVTHYRLLPVHEARWKTVPLAENNRCTLKNGDRVTMHAGEGNAYPFGMGGADPPAFISLWINGRKVLSRYEYKAGHGADGPYLNSLFISGGSIERCVYPDGIEPRGEPEPDPNGVTCSISSYAASRPIDALERTPVDQSLVGTYSIAAKYNPTFCRRFVWSYQGNERIHADPQQLLGWSSPFEAANATVLQQSKDAWGVNVRSATFDFWNEGATDTVLQTDVTARYMTTEMLFLQYNPVGDDAVASLAAKMDTSENPDFYVKLAKEAGWQLLPNPPGVWGGYEVFQIFGTTYVLAKPFGGPTVLYRPHRQDGGYVMDPVCTFQLIEDDF